MQINVDSSHVIKALQDELATVTNRLMMATAMTSQLVAEKEILQGRLESLQAQVTTLKKEIDEQDRVTTMLDQHVD